MAPTTEQSSSSSSSCCSFHADDDYIDMELTSSSSSSPNNFFCYSINSPPQSREFEFQMCSIPNDIETTTSPADELFYKGKLLPLHLPPRLQMVQTMLKNPTSTNEESFEDNYSIPFIINPLSITPSSSTTSTTTTTTPLESCNISPSESCRVSSEFNADDCFFELSTELHSFISYAQQPARKSWTNKLKKSLFGQKLKSSSSYLKSLFNKSGCADDSCAKAKSARNIEPEIIRKETDCSNKYVKAAKKNLFDNERSYKFSTTLKRSVEKEMASASVRARDSLINTQRRSFSGVIQRHSKNNNKSFSCTSSSGSSSSSSSFSFSSSNGGFYDLQLLKRSISANSEKENSIEGAIAYCKMSQQQLFNGGDPEKLKLCSV